MPFEEDSMVSEKCDHQGDELRVPVKNDGPQSSDAVNTAPHPAHVTHAWHMLGSHRIYTKIKQG